MDNTRPGLIHYEVFAMVRDDLVDAYEQFLPAHVEAVLAAGKFDSAVISRAAPAMYRVRYTTTDHAVIDRYLAEHAPRLRGEAQARFPDGIQWNRAVWTDWLHLTP
jgi:hypothetical protein